MSSIFCLFVGKNSITVKQALQSLIGLDATLIGCAEGGSIALYFL